MIYRYNYWPDRLAQLKTCVLCKTCRRGVFRCASRNSLVAFCPTPTARPCRSLLRGAPRWFRWWFASSNKQLRNEHRRDHPKRCSHLWGGFWWKWSLAIHEKLQKGGHIDLWEWFVAASSYPMEFSMTGGISTSWDGKEAEAGNRAASVEASWF